MTLNSRSYHLARSGDTNKLIRNDNAVPKPDHHQVLIRMGAASLNYRDLLTRQDVTTNRAGLVPLSDGAGTIVAVGSEVSQWKEGDRGLRIRRSGNSDLVVRRQTGTRT